MAPERDNHDEIAATAAAWLNPQGRALTRRGVIRLVGGGAAGLAATAVAGRAAWAQDATPAVEPEADPVADPEAGDGETPTADGTPAGEGGDLTIYSGRSEGLVGPLLERFGEETGIETEVRYAGTAELAATLIEEGDATPAGAFFAQDAGALGLLAQEGRFQPLPDELLERVDPRFRSDDGLWVGVSGRARVLVYNTDELSEADLPSSVLDLTDEAWSGRVGWAPENASFQAFVTALRLLEGDDAARAWLEGMLANDVQNFGDSNSSIVTAVGNGEIQVGLVNHYYLYAVKEEEGEDFPIANHFFAEGDPGSLINVAGVGVLADAEDSEQALRFVEFLLDDEAQTYFAEETSEYPLVAGVPTAEGLTPLAEVGSPEVDLSDLADLQGTIELLTEVGVL
jgi:iron(III) transport system substrate-binding protein